MFAIRLSLILIGILFPFLMFLVADGLRIVAPDLVRNWIARPDPAWQEIVINTRSSKRLFEGFSLENLLFLAVPHLVVAGAMIMTTLSYRHRRAVIFPVLAGFGFLAYAYLMNAFNPDPQGALIYIFGPIYSLVFILSGWLIGLVFDRFAFRK